MTTRAPRKSSSGRGSVNSMHNRFAPPHPFPYQGSKRTIAQAILQHCPNDVQRLVEPFCGSAAVSLAAASRGLAKAFILNDLNKPLMELWGWILERPAELISGYERLWVEQHHVGRKEFFYHVREEFNRSPKPHYLLYLLARIVKGSVRYSASGEFNQSADNRRSGMHPTAMRKQILGVHTLLRNRTVTIATDFREVICHVSSLDLVYMDPPYQGTSFTRDHRYYHGISYYEFADALAEMNNHHISYIVSYDGWTGSKGHGALLPSSLALTHIYVDAGRSAQATLLGKKYNTIESLYLSPALVERLEQTENTPLLVLGGS